MDVQALKIDKKTEAPPPFYSTFYPPPLKMAMYLLRIQVGVVSGIRVS